MLSCAIRVHVTEIECITPPGVGVSLRFVVVIGDQRSALSPAVGGTLSYAAPNVTAVAPSGGVPTAGGLLTVVGRDFARAFAEANVNVLDVRWGESALSVVNWRYDDDDTDERGDAVVVRVVPGLPSSGAFSRAISTVPSACARKIWARRRDRRSSVSPVRSQPVASA